MRLSWLTGLTLLATVPTLAAAEDANLENSESSAEPGELGDGQTWGANELEASSEGALPVVQASDFGASQDSEFSADQQSEAIIHSEPLISRAKPKPHYLRNLLELSATIGVGTTWYWVNEERQVADWDYPSWKEKLTFDTDIMIFDTNDFEVNYTWHTFAGGSSHLLGRSNGLSIGQSFAFGTLASVFWEYGIEARELISLNDLLMTNTTGLPTGEFFHRVAQYVNQGQEGLGWDAARWTLGVGHTAHAVIDGKPVAQDLALTPDVRWYYSLESADITRQDGDAAEQTASSLQHTVGFDGRMVAFDGYMQPGSRQEWFGAANFTDFGISHSRGQGYATRANASTLLAGWRHQNIPEDGSLGTTLNVATSVGYSYNREEYGIWQNRLAGLHAPGLAAEGELLGAGWTLRGDLNVSFDLMGINSQSWQQFKDERVDELGKSILQSTGYYYGYGASTRANASLEVSRFTLGASLFAGRYTSIEGYDREKATLEMEVAGDDDFFDYELSLSGDIYKQAYARARWGQVYRQGNLGTYSAEQSLSRANFELGLHF